MRAPLSWIREFTPVEADPVAIAEALDTLGLEVEAIEAPGREINGVKAAKALDVRKHPDADKLSLVDVDFGSGTTTVVCGAPNVVAGMVMPYAPSGATLPGGFTLERAQDPRDRLGRHAVLAQGARARRRSFGDPRPRCRHRARRGHP